MSCFKKEFLNKCVVWYVILFFLYSIMGRIVPLANVVEGMINQILYIIFAGVGVLFLLLDLVNERNMFKTKYNKILILFLVVMTISCILNVNYGFSDNIKTLVWTSIQLLLIYTMYVRLGKERIRSLIEFLFRCMIGVWFITGIVSIGQYLMRIGYCLEHAGMLKRQGFVENRLFGVYNDPNYAAITALYVIVMSLYLFKMTTKKKHKAFYITSVFVQYIYIVLSGSRTAEICMVLVVVGITILWVRRFLLEKDWGIIKNVLVILVCVVVTVVLFIAGYGVSKQVLGKIPSIATNNSGSHTDSKLDNILHRMDTDESNISNNRFKIWKEYVNAVRGKKIILGLSPRNANVYIQENYAGSYLDKTKYETHNAYLSLYVSTGIVGTGIVFLFICIVLVKVIKVLLCKNELDELFVCSLFVEMIILVYAFFFSDLFFVNNLTTTFFWILLGVVTEKMCEDFDKRGGVK